MEGPSVGPPEEAYGRVTGPERYAVLHPAAQALVDDLTARYVVERLDDWQDPDIVGRVDVVSAVRLVPAGGGAPITVALTAFPGVVVHFGRWHIEPFPSCGCDACDENPDDVVAQLSRSVDAVVAGRFREELLGGRRHDVLGHELWGDGWRTSGTTGPPDRARADEVSRPAVVTWRPWPRRRSGP